MNILKGKLLLISIITGLVACKKDINNSQTQTQTQSGPHVYTSSVILKDVPTVMGGCLDTSGHFLTFQQSLVDSPIYNCNVLISARVLQLNPDSVAFDFGSEKFFGSSMTSLNAGTKYGWTEIDERYSLACTKSGDLFLAENGANDIRWLHYGQSSTYQNMENVFNLTTLGNNLYAITGPSLDRNGVLVLQPQVFVSSFTSIADLYYTFPLSEHFTSFGYYDGFFNDFPIDMAIDMKMAADSSLYIAFAYDNVIYKLDKNKILTKYIVDIFCPASIDFDNSGKLFVLSGPMFHEDASYNCTMTKPLEIYSVDSPGKYNKIYSGNLTSIKGGSYDILQHYH